MAASTTSISTGLTASVNQTFKFSKIVVMGATVMVSTAFVLFLGWIAGLDGLQKRSLAFLRYLFQMIGIMGAFYLVLSAMVAVGKMAAASTSGKKMGFVGGFIAIPKSVVKVVFATLVPVGVLVVAVGLLWVIGWIGRIPKVGPIVWGIAAIVPILIGLIATFVLAKLFLTVFLVPGIIATTDQSGYKCYKLASGMVKNHLVKLLAWFIVVFILMSLFFTILSTGLSIMRSHTRKTMGPNADVMTAAPILKVLKTQAIKLGRQSIVAPWTSTAPMMEAMRNPRSNAFPGPWASILTPQHSGVGDGVIKTGGWFYGIELGIVLVILCACGYIFFTLGGMYAYGALSSEPEDPISVKVPVNFADIAQRAAKLTESVSEKVKAEMADEEEKKSTGKK